MDQIVPFILRKIRKSKWYKSSSVPWLTEGQLQADSIGDLRTTDNALSVWLIDEERSNLERIVAALAVGDSGGQSLANFDYFLIDEQHLQNLDISSEESPANTLDSSTNLYHRDLVKLTASNLIALAELVLNHGSTHRVPHRSVIRMVQQSVSNGYLDDSQLSQSILGKLG